MNETILFGSQAKAMLNYLLSETPSHRGYRPMYMNNRKNDRCVGFYLEQKGNECVMILFDNLYNECFIEEKWLPAPSMGAIQNFLYEESFLSYCTDSIMLGTPLPESIVDYYAYINNKTIEKYGLDHL